MSYFSRTALPVEEPIIVVPVRVSNGVLINYTYIVYRRGESDCILIDPSWEAPRILGEIEVLNLTPSVILLTHAHHDHIHSLDFFIFLFQPQVWLSDVEAAFDNFSRSGLRLFGDGELLNFNKMEITTILTSGHTAGSACFLIGNNLFTGDTLFVEGCGTCTSKGSSADGLFHSLQKIKNYTDPQTQIYPGHSFGRLPGETYSEVEKVNIYLQFRNANDFVKFRTRSNQTTKFNYI